MFKARQRLHTSVPPRYRYHMGVAQIKNVDEEDVGRSIMKSTWHLTSETPRKVPLHLISFDGKEVFCCGAAPLCFPGGINQLRVGLMVICPADAVPDGNSTDSSSEDGDP